MAAHPHATTRSVHVIGSMIELALDALDAVSSAASECKRYQRPFTTVGQLNPRPRILRDARACRAITGLDWSLLFMVRRFTQTLYARIDYDPAFLCHVLHVVLPGKQWAPLTLQVAEALGVTLPDVPGWEVQVSPMNLRPATMLPSSTNDHVARGSISCGP